jgi:hypothetical protein
LAVIMFDGQHPRLDFLIFFVSRGSRHSRTTTHTCFRDMTLQLSEGSVVPL